MDKEQWAIRLTRPDRSVPDVCRLRRRLGFESGRRDGAIVGDHSRQGETSTTARDGASAATAPTSGVARAHAAASSGSLIEIGYPAHHVQVLIVKETVTGKCPPTSRYPPGRRRDVRSGDASAVAQRSHITSRSRFCGFEVRRCLSTVPVGFEWAFNGRDAAHDCRSHRIRPQPALRTRGCGCRSASRSVASMVFCSHGGLNWDDARWRALSKAKSGSRSLLSSVTVRIGTGPSVASELRMAPRSSAKAVATHFTSVAVGRDAAAIRRHPPEDGADGSKTTQSPASSQLSVAGLIPGAHGAGGGDGGRTSPSRACLA